MEGGNAAARSDAVFPADRMKEHEAHLTALILEKHELKKKVESLEAELGELRHKLKEMAAQQRSAETALSLSTDTVQRTAALSEISVWNEELMYTVEKLQTSLIHVETDSKAQIIALTDQVQLLARTNERLEAENETLKHRVAEDVLRQRQTNRIEMAFERARIASRVRQASLRRIECAEAALMEAHDDVYYIQRWDALLLPQRDVSFVFHYVSGVVFPLNGVEQLVISVYQQLLLTASNQVQGHHAGCYRGMEVFVFQSPSDALLFAKDCHEQVVSLSWPPRAESLPYLSTIRENGTILFKGPRIHTCIYACTPESDVDPVTGRYAFFGPEVLHAVEAAISQSCVGEIAVNDKWAQLLCKQARLAMDSAEEVHADASDLRASLGSKWDVVSLPGTCGLVASILPTSLVGRRGVQSHTLFPTPKYPGIEMENPGNVARAVVKALKGAVAPLQASGERVHGEASPARQNFAFLSDMSDSAFPFTTKRMPLSKNSNADAAVRLLELFSLQQEKENITSLYRRTELACAGLERDAMEAEDRFEISKRKDLAASETAYVCTIDIGEEAMWKRILMNMSSEQFGAVLSSLRSYHYTAAQVHYGFLMNGNYADVFTYVFREVEQALAFVAEVYIKVNRVGTKYAHGSTGSGRDLFLFRAGITCGPMSTIYRNMDSGVLKCTGPAIRLSGTLCDLSQSGEILAMQNVIRAYHAKKENLIDTQYNIVKQGSQFVDGVDSPAVVHSILPKPFAYRRQKLMKSGGPTVQQSRLHLPQRSVSAALATHQQTLPRKSVLEMLEQQLRRLECVEASKMSAEDSYELKWDMSSNDTLCPLRNPWILLSQPNAEQLIASSSTRRGLVSIKTTEELDADIMYTPRSTMPIAFLYCDVVGTTSITRQLSPPMRDAVYAHYNYIILRIFRILGGYVAKTNSATGYLVLFTVPEAAVEAARLIQLELVSTAWPDALHTLEAALHVKDAKTGDVLFSGLRPQIGVHLSNQFKWRILNRRSSAEPIADEVHGFPSVDVFGTAVDEVVQLGRQAHGGESRLSEALLEALGTNPSGKMLMEQLVMEVIASAPNKSMDESFNTKRTRSANSAAGERKKKNRKDSIASFVEESVSSVPRQLAGRMALLLVPQTAKPMLDGGDEAEKKLKTAGRTKEEMPPIAGKTPLSQTSLIDIDDWCKSSIGASARLPIASYSNWDQGDADTTDTPYRRVGKRLEDAIRGVLDMYAILGNGFISGNPLDLSDAGLAADGEKVRRRGSTPQRSIALSPYFVPFLIFSKQLLSLLVDAMAIGNDQVPPPPLPQPPQRLSPYENDVIAKGGSQPPKGRPSSLGSTRNVSLPSLANISSSNYLVPKPPSTGGKRSSNLAKTSQSSLSDSSLKEDSYLEALDYLDDAFRIFVQQSGATQNKLSSIPSAPQAKGKTFPPKSSSASSRRR